MKGYAKQLNKNTKRSVVPGKKFKKIEPKQDSFDEVTEERNFDDEELENEDDEADDELSVEKHKEDLKNLEKIDPEFHKFLQDNDKELLNFETSRSEDEDETEESQYHEPPESLEVASDASDYEDDSAADVSGKVTIQMVDTWEKELNANNRGLKPLKIAVRAFHACLIRISADSSNQDANNLRVDGSAVFNAVIRLCVTSLYPYLSKLMNLPSSSVTKKHIEGSKKWKHVKSVIRSYLINLIKLLNNVTSEDILRVLLKHLHNMIPFAACLPTISKPLLKQVITLWSTNSSDTVKVTSFLCLLRYASCDVDMYLNSVLKKMYFNYVTNCKFISQNSLPSVNFMRKSLMEMFSLNETIAYNHAFLYIRELAIHLRAAVSVNKKDSIQAVYNWQFISSLRLWVDVLCNMCEKQQMSSLVYPTTQIIIGCIKLIPTAQYFPLRFHCIQMLIKLSKGADVFIPVLPFLVEALSILHLSTKHKKLSMKPMDFTYILRLSKSQLQENAFKDAVVENVHDCLLEYTASESYRISFPDTVVLLQIHVKQFLKECKNAIYSKKLKLLLDKIEDVSKMINQERSKCGIALSDAKGIAAWESNMKLKSNSLISFYQSWCKIQERKEAHKTTDEIQMGGFELPVLKKLPGKKTSKKETLKKKGDRVVLFDSDVDDDDIEFDFEKTDGKEEEEKGKKKLNKKTTRTESKKNKRKIKEDKRTSKVKKRKVIDARPVEGEDDVVKDFKLDDFLS